MTTTVNALPESSLPSQPAAPAGNLATRPFYWSVRRELWENRSIYIAPIAAGCLSLFGFIISAIGLPERRRAVLLLEDMAQQRARIEAPYDMIAMMLMFTSFIVGVFYCLDALHSERRDRSILFWKSLPVSDLTTVLSKLSIPLVVLPLLTFAVIVVTQILMWLWTAMLLLANGLPLATAEQLPLFRSWIVLLYGLIALKLWHAPIYAWLLLVSGWARRATFLWAVLPLLAIAALERIAFGTSQWLAFLAHRLFGGMSQAFAFNKHVEHPTVDLQQLTPGTYLATPGLWLGLLFAAAVIAGAVHLRRSRGPL
ncbi:MAG: ABC transporter, permease protein [uncultured Chthoniobacterales bacterium]|uniref:ABC transporter, permease protein n=1 Tax=uncultured Chthoniobacterales bacterium TaxID=1836801 RepID=A0A6J4IHQ5_9BACT|nr:MAG: ABC transporter, permease protein [uncultured Chthoniobacterales bacterium]